MEKKGVPCRAARYRKKKASAPPPKASNSEEYKSNEAVQMASWSQVEEIEWPKEECSAIESDLKNMKISNSSSKRLSLKPKRTNPDVYVATCIEETEFLCNLIMKENPKLLAFDTETTVSREERKEYVSLIQIGSHKMCILIQIYSMCRWGKDGNPERIPTALQEIFESKKVMKIGTGIHADIKSLLLYGIKCQNVMDMQSLSQFLGIPRSLSKLCSIYAAPQYRDKTVGGYQSYLEHRKRYWDCILNEEEVNYASKDVFRIFSILHNLISRENKFLFFP